MVTVLIDDRRTGVDELAEIKVPLKPADDAEGGYWADAGDVCEKLQTGPSRIDGMYSSHSILIYLFALHYAYRLM